MYFAFSFTFWELRPSDPLHCLVPGLHRDMEVLQVLRFAFILENSWIHPRLVNDSEKPHARVSK